MDYFTKSLFSPLFGSLQPKVTESNEPANSPNSNLSPTVTSFGIDDDNTEYFQRPSACFKRYELMMEFMNLRNSSQYPLGVYLIPCADTLNVWYGILFLHQGLYNSGIFKFRLSIPENYPFGMPSVTFLTDIFHPLIDSQGALRLSSAFPVWRPYQDYIIHLLCFIKNMFKKSTLDKLLDKHCANKEAYRLYRQEMVVFKKLAQQCAQLSITESYLYDHFPDNNLIRFTPLGEQAFGKYKKRMKGKG
ncbi:ubiquitin-conjugating enzyme/RWD-like protein [Absidia repens]|uniref:Ubiquitin-conjugating enzyme/RWD-like protein n=1 Tax=Absidia repens TaxID=90262 RepID=A0A1X2I0K2_9FUNG|nr:ubiquitin-conjugating enzyme/RWD-like protein [Absidia repens]